MPYSKYIHSEDDPKRYTICVPVNNKLKKVLDSIHKLNEEMCIIL